MINVDIYLQLEIALSNTLFTASAKHSLKLKCPLVFDGEMDKQAWKDEN